VASQLFRVKENKLTQQTVMPGAMYGVPGVTQRFEQQETTVGNVVGLALANQPNNNTVQNFQQTDVVHWWEVELSWINTPTGSAGPSLSPYAPYNLYQAFSIQMQGQYKPIDLQSGIDAAIFQLYRPMRGSAQMAAQPLLGANPSNTYANAALPQSNAVAFPNMASNTTPVPIYLEFPSSLWFDQYWDLAEDGAVLAAPISAYVSPQYMSGGQRVVKPKATYAAINATTADVGPVSYSTPATGVGGSQVTDTWRRVGVYASTDPAAMPPVFNWQYQRHSFQFPVAGKTKVTIPITDFGQILSVWLRFFDPSSGAFGAPVNIVTGNVVTLAQLLYGSNLPRFYDDIPAMQKRFLDQHGFLPPVGTIIWDLALTDTGGYVTNAKAINTLTNSNVNAVVNFTSALSATAYCVVGIESLVYVAIQ
jgi:hypothetical protein